MIDINELRRLTQGATPGPWQVWHGWVAAQVDKDGGVVIVERPTPSGGKYQARVDANFRFIAAANPAAVAELLDRLEAVEKERDTYKAAYNEWAAKTEWVQQGINEGTISAKYLGLHRADIMASLLGAAEKERDALRALVDILRSEISALRAKIEQMESRIELLEHDLKSGDYETLYAQTVVELAQLRKDADKFDDGIDWIQRALQAEAEITRLRAKIEAIERQEPVAWCIIDEDLAMEDNLFFNTKAEAQECIDENRCFWVRFTPGPLYALPGAKGEEK